MAPASAVTRVPAAAAPDAVRHFAARSAFETEVGEITRRVPDPLTAPGTGIACAC